MVRGRRRDIDTDRRTLTFIRMSVLLQSESSVSFLSSHFTLHSLPLLHVKLFLDILRHDMAIEEMNDAVGIFGVVG